MPPRRRLCAGALIAALVILSGSACGGGDLFSRLGIGGSAGPPPPVEIQTAEKSFQLHAWTYCYRNTCADGIPPEKPLSVGSPSSVEVHFPLSGWSFDATFVEVGSTCPRRITVPVEGGQLLPAGPAGAWDVELFGRGDEDLATSFRWETPVDGAMPSPQGSASVVTDNDGQLDSYGVEVGVFDLKRTPRRASATITVTAANGSATTIETKRQPGCSSAGSANFTASDVVGKRAAGLGEAPFTYTARLTLDGTTYVGTGSWPEDEIEEQSPAVGLTFDPPLPAFGVAD